MQKIRVLHILQSNKFSGAENVVCQIIEMFENDPNYEMAYCSPEGPIRDALSKKQITYFGLDRLSVKNVKKILNNYHPAIIHAHDVTASLIAVISTIGIKIDIISHIHVNHENMSHFNAKTFMYKISSRAYKHIFWVSESCFENYKYKNAVIPKSSVLTNIINKNEVIEKAALEHKKYNYSVVYVGRITYQKNPEKLLKVLELVINQLTDVRIAIVGNGDMLENICELVRKRKLDNSIHVLGFMDNPYGIIKSAKVLLMTSRYEGLPMTVLESLALGTPVVSTPVDGLLNVIENGENGFLATDNQDLANKVCQIVTSDALYKEMSAKAIKMFDRIMNLDLYKQKIQEVYEK